jgi:hypothetical protein
VLVTDKLGSYGAAKAEIGLSARHERACARTIGLKIRISRHGDASADAALQIAGISPALSVDSRGCTKHLQR